MKNVSQPVLLIGKLLQEDRDRFKMRDGVTCDLWPLIAVLDSKTQKQFKVVIRGNGCVCDQPWMTREESEYLGELVAKIYMTEKVQKEEIEKQRQRSEWLGAYNEEL